MTLVERDVALPDDCRDDARPGNHIPDGADAAIALADLADFEREFGRRTERITPLVHGRRAGVRRLARKADGMALDPKRAEHNAERQVHALQHRPLLDVQ